MFKNILGIGVIGALAYFFFQQKKRLVEFLRVNYKDIAIDSKATNISQIVFNLKLNLDNPTSGTVIINEIVGVIEYQDARLASFNSTDNFTISPRTSKDVIIKVKITTFGVIGSFIKIISSDEPIVFNIKGYIGTNFGKVDYEEEQAVNADFDAIKDIFNIRPKRRYT